MTQFYLVISHFCTVFHSIKIIPFSNSLPLTVLWCSCTQLQGYLFFMIYTLEWNCWLIFQTIIIPNYLPSILQFTLPSVGHLSFNCSLSPWKVFLIDVKGFWLAGLLYYVYILLIIHVFYSVDDIYPLFLLCNSLKYSDTDHQSIMCSFKYKYFMVLLRTEHSPTVYITLTKVNTYIILLLTMNIVHTVYNFFYLLNPQPNQDSQYIYLFSSHFSIFL